MYSFVYTHAKRPFHPGGQKGRKCLRHMARRRRDSNPPTPPACEIAQTIMLVQLAATSTDPL